MLTALEVAEKIAGSGPVMRVGAQWQVRCPAHEDDKPSLTVATGHTQPVVLNCHAGCELDAILDAAGLDIADIAASADYDVRQEPPIRRSRVARVYRYRDEEGVHLFDVLRLDPKGFAQRRPDASARDGWAYTLGDCRRVPYRLPEALAAVARGEELWITEGERDVHALYTHGVTATCNPMGAGKWSDDYSELLRDATVTIVADRDPSGQTHARNVRESLMRFGATARIVEAHPSVTGKGADAADHFNAGFGIEDFIETVPYEGLPSGAMLALDIDSYLGQPMPERVFVIDNTLARGEVIGITGFEGAGKSLLLKQIAVCTAIGLHPFRLTPMTPRRVLFIDCENTALDNMADFRLLRHKAEHYGHWEGRERLYIIEQNRMNLMDPQDVSWLLERVNAHKPDLLVVGPLYNMVNKELSSEDNARAVQLAINSARDVNGCAVAWEHHVPLPAAGNTRDVRPIGSSLLLRWPNFGYGMKPTDTRDTYEWFGWRGPRRRERSWPSYLRIGHGTEWPWMEAEPPDN